MNHTDIHNLKQQILDLLKKDAAHLTVEDRAVLSIAYEKLREVAPNTAELVEKQVLFRVEDRER